MLTTNHFKLLDRCIAEGISIGTKRAFKHVDNPSANQIEIEVYQAVMNEIYEWFTETKDERINVP